MEYPEVDNTAPLVFEFSKKGPVIIDPSGSGSITSSAAITKTIKTPQTYG